MHRVQRSWSCCPSESSNWVLLRGRRCRSSAEWFGCNWQTVRWVEKRIPPHWAVWSVGCCSNSVRSSWNWIPSQWCSSSEWRWWPNRSSLCCRSWARWCCQWHCNCTAWQRSERGKWLLEMVKHFSWVHTYMCIISYSQIYNISNSTHYVPASVVDGSVTSSSKKRLHQIMK